MRVNGRKALSSVTFAFVVVFFSSTLFAQTTEFTYQGRLLDSNLLPTANYDFQFSLWDSLANGTQVGTTQIANDVAVTSGIFTVRLDFGSTAFTDGGARFLQIEVRPGSSTGAYTTLNPRQTMTSAPHAIKALKSSDADSLGGVAATNYLLTNGDGSNLSNVAKLDTNNVFTGADNSFSQITLSGDGQIVAPRLENFAGNPAPASSGNAGRVYFNTLTNTVRVSNGTTWMDLSSVPRRIQTFSGVTAQAFFNCTNTTTAIRMATFTKSFSSRLRITVKDTASAFGPNVFSLSVSIRIDGVLVTNPTPLRMVFGSNGGGGLFEVFTTYTAVGYVDGVTGGEHTLTTTYSHTSTLGGSFQCMRTDEPYFIEIEEIPS
jgi:hypothetical protein